MTEETRGKRPRYYLQNFHYQSGGWMTDNSAERYDTQVEVLLTAQPMRAREEGAAALWLMAVLVAALRFGERAGPRLPPFLFLLSPTRARKKGAPRSPSPTAAMGRSAPTAPVFISSLTYTRARGGRRRALADGRTMVAGADDGERATGSSPTDRQIPRTDTGRLPSRAQRYGFERSAE